jgi:arsenite methyltransferase
VISNCVINLSPDKKKVFQEIYRVLKPNGKMVVSDIVAEGIPEKLKGILWSSCVGGALDEASYLRAIQETGLKDVRVVDRLDYDRPMIQGLLGSGCLDLPPEVRKQIAEDREEWKAKISSIRVSGKKS